MLICIIFSGINNMTIKDSFLDTITRKLFNIIIEKLLKIYYNKLDNIIFISCRMFIAEQQINADSHRQ
jgi:hypothetical protein